MLRDMVLYIFYIKSGAEVLSIRWVFQMINMSCYVHYIYTSDLYSNDTNVGKHNVINITSVCVEITDMQIILESLMFEDLWSSRPSGTSRLLFGRFR